MELRHLRYFTAVAEELHFGRAAARLHIAQSPLSQQIRRLEAEFGVALFERNRRSVRLTDAGRLLLELAEPLLGQADRLERTMHDAAAGDAGTLTVGFVGSASYRTLPAIVRAFSHTHPLVVVRLEELTTSPQVEALETGRIDVGLVRPPVGGDALEVIPLVEERLVVALPDSHPLAELEIVPVRALADEPFVSFPRRIGAGLYDDIVAVCAAAGFSPEVVQEANEMQTIVSLVSAGIGVALVPESMQNFTLPHLAMRPLRGSSAILRLALAHRADSASPLVRAFVAAAVTAAREPVYFLP